PRSSACRARCPGPCRPSGLDRGGRGGRASDGAAWGAPGPGPGPRCAGGRTGRSSAPRGSRTRRRPRPRPARRGRGPWPPRWSVRWSPPTPSAALPLLLGPVLGARAGAGRGTGPAATAAALALRGGGGGVAALGGGGLHGLAPADLGHQVAAALLGGEGLGLLGRLLG